MRILVLQLARFGDIYQSWPTLRALQRKHPGCELHVLVRARFVAALTGFPGIHVHQFPTAEILRPIVENDSQDGAHQALCDFLAPVVALKFDLVVNLSFSPASSYLTDILTTSHTQVRGYSRTEDGHLAIADDTSAYFYAQVGVGKFNRYHVTEIFAAVAEVELCESDYHIQPIVTEGERQGVIVHLGASTGDKAYSPELWVQALRELSAQCSQPICLVGSAGEKAMADTVAAQIGSANVKNLVGVTTLDELFKQIASAKLLIGADSAPMHIAALTATPVLNLSCARVNFWETGPRSSQARVLYSEDLQNLSPQTLTSEALAMLNGEGPKNPCWVRDAKTDTYVAHGIQDDLFAWRLIEALYTGAPYPPAESAADILAFQRLYELTELALHQMDRWNDKSAQTTVALILQQVDAILIEIPKLNPRVGPMVEWFQTQRVRIPQGSNAETLQRTRDTFQDFLWVTKVYRQFGTFNQEIQKAIGLCRECAPELRECDPGIVQSSFQALISTLQEIARHSTKVGNESWSSVLKEIGENLERRDFIALADLVQWKLIPAFELQLKANEQETLSQDVIS